MTTVKTALVLGSSGFIGINLVKRLKRDGWYVVGCDIIPCPVQGPESEPDEFFLNDLRDPRETEELFCWREYDEVYQLAADVGGAIFVHAGLFDADIMSNSVSINVNVLKMCVKYKVGRIFFASSVCVYHPGCSLNGPQGSDECAECVETEAYPAMCDNNFGWEKLFSERMYSAFERQYSLKVRIGRLHSITGEFSCFKGNREKAHAALIRKVIECPDLGDQGPGEIEIIGDGQQIRTFLYVEDCVDAMCKLTRCDSPQASEPLNIGDDHFVTINEYLEILKAVSGKDFKIKNVPGPTGMKGRKCDLTKIKSVIDWTPQTSLYNCTVKTYNWILEQMRLEKM